MAVVLLEILQILWGLCISLALQCQISPNLRLATHVYYLWGEAKFTDYLARGTPAQNAALNLEHFARQAHHAAGQLLEDSHVPLARPPPNLPVEVSQLPLLPLRYDRYGDGEGARKHGEFL